MSRRTPAAARGREAASTRDVILDAAERRFAERGFAGVSMREIAADAGLRNQASLYHHFRHKRALYEAVLARGIEPILGLVAESAAAGAPGSWGETAVDRLVVYLADHPHLPRLIQRAALEDRRYLPSVIPRLLRPLYQQGLRALAETRTPWAPADMPHLASALYLLIFGYFASAALFEAVTQQDPRSPAAVMRQRRFVKSALGRLFAGPAPEPAPRTLRRRSS
ncbi:MAG: TetR/AcrR family transcriptional regulator [bacterium]|nr:TetR/AcrR family transcriptional regulator [bacterium]